MNINWLAASVAALFVLFMVNGWRKGFLKIVISFAGTIVILIAVVILSPKVSRYAIENTGMYEKTRQKVISVFLDRLEQNDEKDGVLEETVSDNDRNRGIDDLNIPEIMKNDLIEKNASEMYQALLTRVFKDYISGYIAKLIINAGSFVGVYIALSVMMWFIVRTSDIVAKIPVIKGFNKFMGLITGTAEALIIVWVFFFIIIMFLGNDIGGRLLSLVQRSVFLTFLFNNNYLFRFIS